MSEQGRCQSGGISTALSSWGRACTSAGVLWGVAAWSMTQPQLLSWTQCGSDPSNLIIGYIFRTLHNAPLYGINATSGADLCTAVSKVMATELIVVCEHVRFANHHVFANLKKSRMRYQVLIFASWGDFTSPVHLLIVSIEQ